MPLTQELWKIGEPWVQVFLASSLLFATWGEWWKNGLSKMTIKNNDQKMLVIAAMVVMFLTCKWGHFPKNCVFDESDIKILRNTVKVAFYLSQKYRWQMNRIQKVNDYWSRYTVKVWLSKTHSLASSQPAAAAAEGTVGLLGEPCWFSLLIPSQDRYLLGSSSVLLLSGVNRQQWEAPGICGDPAF